MKPDNHLDFVPQYHFPRTLPGQPTVWVPSHPDADKPRPRLSTFGPSLQECLQRWDIASEAALLAAAGVAVERQAPISAG